MLYNSLRPLLFALPPETAHALSLRALSARAKFAAPQPIAKGALSAMGLRFDNPVGLAAGMDKNGACIDGFGALGFGFIEIGAATPLPQIGNPRPRLFRLPAAGALINRMGFNNIGAARIKNNLSKRKYAGIVGINLGKNAATPPHLAAADFIASLRVLYEHGDFFTINVSSPNTKGLRDFQQGEALQNILPKIIDARDSLSKQHNKRAPLAIKIAPDLNNEEIAEIAEVSSACGIDAVIATNTATARPLAITGMRHASEKGGLSGKPLRERSTEIIKQLRELLPRQTAIIGVGGIFTPADAREKLQAGAQLIQLYTGLIYRGPSLPAQIINALN